MSIERDRAFGRLGAAVWRQGTAVPLALLAIALVVTLAACRESAPGPLIAPPSETHLGQPSWVSQDGDPGLGPATAPVTVVVFSDYRCPNCRQFAAEVLPWLAAGWMARGLVRVVYRDFAVLGPESERAAVAAQCAGAQGRFWAFHDALFGLQAAGGDAEVYSDERLNSLADHEGLDPLAFRTCLEDGQALARVRSSTAHAREAGYEGTPTYAINGRTTSGAIPVERWDELFGLYARELGLSGPSGTPGGRP